MKDLAQFRIRYGCRRIHVLLHGMSLALGKNLVYRPYTEEGLQLGSRRPKRRKMAVLRRERYVSQRPSQACAMDFVADQLVDGARFGALTVVDVFTREAMTIRVGQQLRAEQVIEECNRLAAQRGAPVGIFVDNGSEFSGHRFDL